VFILLENQHCAAPGSTIEGPQIPTDPCASAPKVNEPQFDSPCYNGGSCKSMGSNSSLASTLNYTCMCPPGFTGPLCEINIDDCLDHQCQNGAMCVDGVNSYRCICRDPTTSGEFCEQLAPSSTSAPVPSFSFPYATSSAASLSTLPLVAPPLALPIISSGSGTSGQTNLVVESTTERQQTHGPPQQILARSADFSHVPSGLSSNPNDRAQQQQQPYQTALEPDQTETRPIGGVCQRLTERKYFDDGNGCQSVRLLKLSTCAGTCGQTGGCCQPAKVKRRRVRMQCSDGASYVKTVDLIKKCSCNNECQSVASQLFTFSKEQGSTGFMPAEKMKANHYFKYLSAKPEGSAMVARAKNQPMETQFSNADVAGPNPSFQEEHMMQITRLDAVD